MFADFGLEKIFPLLLEGEKPNIYQRDILTPSTSFNASNSAPTFSNIEGTRSENISSMVSSSSSFSSITNSATMTLTDEYSNFHNWKHLEDALFNPERLIVVLRAFLLLLADVENIFQKDGMVEAGSASLQVTTSRVLIEGKLNLATPPFPLSSWTVPPAVSNKVLPLSALEDLFNARIKSLNPVNPIPVAFQIPATKLSLNSYLSGSVIQRMGSGLREMLEKLNDVLGKAFFALDAQCGNSLVVDLSTPLSTTKEPTTSMIPTSGSYTEGSSLSGRRNSLSYPAGNSSQTSSASGNDLKFERIEKSEKDSFKEHQNLFDLLRTCIDCLPRLTPTNFSCGRLVELLSRYVLHVDKGIRSSATEALKRISNLNKNELDVNLTFSNGKKFWDFGDKELLSGSVVRIFAEVVGKIENEIFNDILVTLNHEGYENGCFANSAATYIDLLQILQVSVEREILIGKRWTNLEIKRIVEEIEGRGLICFLSQHFQSRKDGIKILNLARSIENVLNNNKMIERAEKDAKKEFNRRSRQFTTQTQQNSKKLKTKVVPNSSRIINIMELFGEELVRKNYLDPVFVSSSRSEQVKSQQQPRKKSSRVASEDALILMASSELQQDYCIFLRCIPELCGLIFEYGCSATVQLCLGSVLARIRILYPSVAYSAEQFSITTLGDRGKLLLNTTVKANSKPSNTVALTEEILDQWKIYSIFAAATVEITAANEIRRGNNTISLLDSKGLPLQEISEKLNSKEKKSEMSKPVLHAPSNLPTIISNSKHLIHILFPLLTCERQPIRQSSVIALTSMHWLSYQTFFEEIQPYFQYLSEDMRNRINSNKEIKGEQSSLLNSNTEKRKTFVLNNNSKKLERLRMELTNILGMIADFVNHDIYRKNDLFMSSIYVYTKTTKDFLSEADIQLEWDHQMLRYYYSCFLEKYYDRLIKSSQPGLTLDRFLPFHTRVELFALFEKWSGHGVQAAKTREREAKMMFQVLDHVKDIRERAVLTQTMEEQRKALEFASMKAMSSLLQGPVYNPKNTSASFNIALLLTWIDSIYFSLDESIHNIGDSALNSLLTFNSSDTHLIYQILDKCYSGTSDSVIARGYFLALVDFIVKKKSKVLIEPHKLICLGMYKVGDNMLSIRKAALELLHFFGKPHAENVFEISYEASAFGNSLPIIYKYSQILISTRLSIDKSEMTYEMLSEIVQRIEQVNSHVDSQNLSQIKDFLILIVPWIRNIELSTTGEREEFAVVLNADQQYIYSPLNSPRLGFVDIILNNLFYLTIQFGDVFVSEIESIWVKLLSFSDSDITLKREITDYEAQLIVEKNVEIVVEYLLNLGVKKRNPKLVMHAKKVIVYLSRTSSCRSLIDALVSRISPKTLVPNPVEEPKRYMNDTSTILSVNKSNLFTVDLSLILSDMPKRPPFSKGQLACVFLVDLTVEIGNEALKPHIPLLMNVIFVQLDHFIALICEQNRLLLVNLIQAVIPRDLAHEMIDGILLTLNSKEGRMWNYEDISPQTRQLKSTKELALLVQQIAELFSIIDPTFPQSWGETALNWGVSCPVRHVACRSLQILRSLSPVFTRQMLGEIFHRLSNTIADATEEIQGFALEILDTLDVMFDSLENHRVILFPQFFWACVACLNSPHEWEYFEAISILEKFLTVVDINDPSILSSILTSIPTKWLQKFDGLQVLLLRGLSSSICEEKCLFLINLLIVVENDQFVDKNPTKRLLHCVLANIPRLLHATESAALSETVLDCYTTAYNLSTICERLGQNNLAHLFKSYSKQKFRLKGDFISHAANGIRQGFFATHKEDILLFFTNLISNPIKYYKINAMRILKLMFPGSESIKSVDTKVGDKLLTPLFALLSTDLYPKSLEVLDEILKNSITAEESNLKLILGGKSIAKIIKEVENDTQNPTQDGAIKGYEQSGWKKVDFLLYSKMCRGNMVNVALLCSQKKSGKRGLGDKKDSIIVSIPINHNPNSELKNSVEDKDDDFTNELEKLDEMLKEENPTQFDLESSFNDYSSFITSIQHGFEIEPTILSPSTISRNENSVAEDTTQLLYPSIFKVEPSISEKLLSLPNANLTLCFKIGLPVQVMKEETEVSTSLKAALAEILNIEANSIIIHRVDADLDLNGNDITTESLVTIKFDELNASQTSRYVEKMSNIIREKQEVLKGVLSDIDLNWPPKIYIEIANLKIPLKKESQFLKFMDLDSPIKKIESNSNLDVSRICESFKLFPALFEMILNYYTEWIFLIGEFLKIHGTAETSGLRAIFECIKGLRIGTEMGYWPPLVATVDLQNDLLSVTKRYLKFKNLDDTFEEKFNLTKENYLLKMNFELKKFLFYQENYLSIFDIKNELCINLHYYLKSAGNFALSLIHLYKAVLELQGILESFLGLKEDNRNLEVENLDRCSIIIENFLAHY
ncbi:Cell morphogenesis protein PAG1 [Clydaea vesicula]|uniref:Cell morphogenesis protein PAG1 n=1 Tax=Clydaea vesicula TaxID=447962 RepID=A0AAD5Y1Z0_9FUNG|nr:Cell morphogenesis protein PAG1 [Clydaea vesicula]